jgi:peptidoglycan/xylan/chitin deacetylase (PgdA/CDA1 family)
MKNLPGHFVISLDYELHWGFFDHKSVDDYRENLENVNLVINRLLELSNTYNVKLTFSTVGFLFAKDKEELLKYAPNKKPEYLKTKLNPYALVNNIGINEIEDPFHYASSMLQRIRNNGNHEIGTHTFSHYYTQENGQTIEDFEEDILAAKRIAEANGDDIKSIVFPRNMVNQEYLDVCYKQNLTSYRGTESAYIYNINPNKKQYNWLYFRLIRLVDSYFNFTGSNTYNLKSLYKRGQIINLPSSRFLRPYSNTLKIFEGLKVRRVKKSMKRAAKNNELFHLWWHPHNFGSNIDANFKNLEAIFEEYAKLNQEFQFTSETMTSLSNKIQLAQN